MIATIIVIYSLWNFAFWGKEIGMLLLMTLLIPYGAGAPFWICISIQMIILMLVLSGICWYKFATQGTCIFSALTALLALVLSIVILVTATRTDTISAVLGLSAVIATGAAKLFETGEI